MRNGWKAAGSALQGLHRIDPNKSETYLSNRITGLYHAFVCKVSDVTAGNERASPEVPGKRSKEVSNCRSNKTLWRRTSFRSAFTKSSHHKRPHWHISIALQQKESNTSTLSITFFVPLKVRSWTNQIRTRRAAPRLQNFRRWLKTCSIQQWQQTATKQQGPTASLRFGSFWWIFFQNFGTTKTYNWSSAFLLIPLHSSGLFPFRDSKTSQNEPF